MLSVLIPTYNYDVTELVNEIHKQCLDLKMPFEILISDDASSYHVCVEQNMKLQQLPHVTVFLHSENMGNAANRNFLSRKAQFHWLLSIDADMVAKNPLFIYNYIIEIQKDNYDVFSGGIYYAELTDRQFILKWTHGKKHEEIREKIDENNILGFRGNNFLIRKSAFLSSPFHFLPETYGYVDTVFGIRLLRRGFKIKMIDNPLQHNGLESAEEFICKTQKAVKNAFYLANNQPEIGKYIRLVRMYNQLKILRLTNLLAHIFKKYKKRMLQNLCTEKPSLVVFQLYKLGYMCSLAKS